MAGVLAPVSLHGGSRWRPAQGVEQLAGGPVGRPECDVPDLLDDAAKQICGLHQYSRDLLSIARLYAAVDFRCQAPQIADYLQLGANAAISVIGLLVL